MPSRNSLVDRLFGSALNRDGQAPVLEAESTGAGEQIAHGAEPPHGEEATKRRHRPVMRPERIIQETLSQKVLDAWLRNRQQTLYPLTINFRSLKAHETSLLVEVMAAAMMADGQAEAAEAEQAEQSLGSVGAGEEERRRLAEALQNPRALSLILADIQAGRLAAHAYAATLIALNQRNVVNQLYLDYLAARLSLPVDVVNSLNRRYRM